MSSLINNILNEHCHDKEQLEVIMSDEDRLMVEAPAGYGKTKTMVNKIKYLILKGKLPKYKKVLCLTFSVNSTNKIMADVSSALNNANFVSEEILKIGNYHSVAKGILAKYGYLIDTNLVSIEKYKIVDESWVNIKFLTPEEEDNLTKFSEGIKNPFETSNLRELILSYNEIIKKYYITAGTLTFNSLLTLTIEILNTYPNLSQFYQNIYPTIIIDEFQDTNFLSLEFIKCLIGDRTKLYLFGDSMQRVYGFMGAIPNLMDIMIRDYQMKNYVLETNHRFQDNDTLKLLNANLRENISSSLQPSSLHECELELHLTLDQYQEAIYILKLVEKLEETDFKDTAILFREDKKNTKVILEYLQSKKHNIFNGLFKENEQSFIEFHSQCLDTFINYLDTTNKVFTKYDISKYLKIINTNEHNVNNSYGVLLKAFLDYIVKENNYAYRNDMIKNVLSNNELKKYMKFISNKVVVTTIHSAKGLEWDNVILPDFEDGIFPNTYFTNRDEEKLIEEVNIFYVAVTRARKRLFFTSSKTQYGRGAGENKEFPTKISIFSKLKGLKFKLIEEVL